VRINFVNTIEQLLDLALKIPTLFLQMYFTMFSILRCITNNIYQTNDKIENNYQQKEYTYYSI
jgi:hypothetical protein